MKTGPGSILALQKRKRALEARREQLSTMLIFSYEPGTRAFQDCLNTIAEVESAIEEADRRITEITELRTRPEGGDV